MASKFVMAAVVMIVGIGFYPSNAVAQGRNVPVPSSCVPQVNAKLEQMVQQHPKGYVENVMVCGVATGTRVNSGGAHGSHHIITLNVTLPVEGAVKVQVAINDSHDVHCSTHPTADNGWVVVNGVKTPSSCGGSLR